MQVQEWPQQRLQPTKLRILRPTNKYPKSYSSFSSSRKNTLLSERNLPFEPFLCAFRNNALDRYRAEYCVWFYRVSTIPFILQKCEKETSKSQCVRSSHENLSKPLLAGAYSCARVSIRPPASHSASQPPHPVWSGNDNKQNWVKYLCKINKQKKRSLFGL